MDETEIKEISTEKQDTTTVAYEISEEPSSKTKAFATESTKLGTYSTTKEISLEAETKGQTSTEYEEKTSSTLSIELEMLSTIKPTDSTEIKESKLLTTSSPETEDESTRKEVKNCNK
ncbi:hypothetical protein CEXT_777181 [Caerostris extrusa]|uniref:Uncharacterized protein n=1 Tax=Caerostris extrusa TaxID=172846 RepID=A0AAV4V5H4_CAEEX|nr:hypothetical protein CEXT_777181 [Caerostris extrusa]